MKHRSSVRLIAECRPELPQMACLDSAFHQGAPEVAQVVAPSQELTESGVRRYGFHGLSYDYIASRPPAIDTGATTDKTVVLHLGNGSSTCAIAAGRSVASTMASPPWPAGCWARFAGCSILALCST